MVSRLLNICGFIGAEITFFIRKRSVEILNKKFHRAITVRRIKLI